MQFYIRYWFRFIFFFIDNQDKYVLKKVYSELLQYNPKLRKDSKLEKLAQSHGCVAEKTVYLDVIWKPFKTVYLLGFIPKTDKQYF